MLILELNVRYPGAKVSLRLLIQKGCQNMGECLCFIFLFMLNLIQFVKFLLARLTIEGNWPFPTMVGLDQLFKFEGFFLPVLKFELFVQYLVKTECKAFKCLES